MVAQARERLLPSSGFPEARTQLHQGKLYPPPVHLSVHTKVAQTSHHAHTQLHADYAPVAPREEMIKQSREEAVKLYKRAYELQQLPATLSPPQSVINATNFLMKALCIAGKPKSASGLLRIVIVVLAANPERISGV